MAKRKRSSTIEESGVLVRIFQRGDFYWLDARVKRKRGQAGGESPRKRLSADTTDRTVAEANARALAREVARQSLFGVLPDTLTLSQVLDAYDMNKGQSLEGQWKRSAETRRRLFLAAWGDIPVASISQTSVDSYCSKRRRAWAETHKGRGPLRDGALDCDFRWLSSVFNWAHKHKLPSGKRLLTENPLHECQWPRESQETIRRPRTSQARYLATLAQAEKIDPAGRFRLALVLARRTGRRIDAILNLSTSDVLLSPERIVGRIAALGHNVEDADAMLYGAIHWRADNDKQGVDRVSPISQEVRGELERYLSANPRVGDVPLLPSVKDPNQAIPRTTATKWLARAEQLAELPKLTGGLWHSYRRLWATERKHLPDVDVAEAGGWQGTKAMKLAYQGSTPSGVLAAVVNG